MTYSNHRPVPIRTLAAAVALALVAGTAAAADSKTYSDRDRMQSFSNEKKHLEKELGTGQPRDHYRTALEKLGYNITAVNYDRPDYLEYEVVKGKDTYEVQVSFKDGKASKVDVTSNVWRADATDRALRANDYRYEYPKATTPNPERASDRDRMKAASSEKDRIEKALGTGHDHAYYRQALEKMGWKVTSTNYDRPDYLEYEVVKGKETYEVQVNFDRASGKSTKVDVTTNAWKADATEKALSAG